MRVVGTYGMIHVMENARLICSLVIVVLLSCSTPKINEDFTKIVPQWLIFEIEVYDIVNTIKSDNGL